MEVLREIIEESLKSTDYSSRYIFLPDERKGNPEFNDLPRLMLDIISQVDDDSLYQITYHGQDAITHLETMLASISKFSEIISGAINASRIEFTNVIGYEADGVVFKYDVGSFNFSVRK